MDSPPEPTEINPESYIRRQDPKCRPEDMITVEPVSLRKGGTTILGDLRRVDTKLCTVIFFAVLSAAIFLYMAKLYRNTVTAALYTTSAVTMFSIVFSLAFGVDFLSAIGAAIHI